MKLLNVYSLLFQPIMKTLFSCFFKVTPRRRRRTRPQRSTTVHDLKESLAITWWTSSWRSCLSRSNMRNQLKRRYRWSVSMLRRERSISMSGNHYNRSGSICFASSEWFSLRKSRHRQKRVLTSERVSHWSLISPESKLLRASRRSFIILT